MLLWQIWEIQVTAFNKSCKRKTKAQLSKGAKAICKRAKTPWPGHMALGQPSLLSQGLTLIYSMLH